MSSEGPEWICCFYPGNIWQMFFFFMWKDHRQDHECCCRYHRTGCTDHRYQNRSLVSAGQITGTGWMKDHSPGTLPYRIPDTEVFSYRIHHVMNDEGYRSVPLPVTDMEDVQEHFHISMKTKNVTVFWYDVFRNTCHRSDTIPGQIIFTSWEWKAAVFRRHRQQTSSICDQVKISAVIIGRSQVLLFRKEWYELYSRSWIVSVDKDIRHDQKAIPDYR